MLSVAKHLRENLPKGFLRNSLSQNLETMQKQIWILGDSPLVEEYTTLCVENEYDTKVLINTDGLLKGITDDETQVYEPDTMPDVVLELTNISAEAKKKNLALLDEIVPFHIPFFSSSVTITISEQATWVKYPSRLTGIGAFPTLLEHQLIEFSKSHLSGNMASGTAQEFAASLGKSAIFVKDSAGLVLPRILCALVNEACFAIMEGAAEAPAIDTAMKLGTNYPHGPVEWAERIGAKHVQAVMLALHKHFGEDRYRSAPLLQKAALRGTFSD